MPIVIPFSAKICHDLIPLKNQSLRQVAVVWKHLRSFINDLQSATFGIGGFFSRIMIYRPTPIPRYSPGYSPGYSALDPYFALSLLAGPAPDSCSACCATV